MITLDKNFSPAEVDALRAMKGKTLDGLGYVPVSANVAFGRVRLYLDGPCADLVVDMCDIDYDGGGESDDDEAFFSVEPACGDVAELSEIVGDELRAIVGKCVKRVLVISNCEETYEADAPTFALKYPQAIVFDLGDEYVCVDKESGPWKMVAVKRGSDLEKLIYKYPEQWFGPSDEEPGFRCEFSRKIVEL